MGIVGFARALATEVGDLGITVNVVSPGMTRTPMVEAGLPPGSLESAAQVRAIKRVAEPKDLAGAVVFLTGEDSGFVTGQTLLVNGGTTFG
jgi:NAD(P)-dependent dehydrogenase (short-subunit alcohol dehydrogenase family)